MGDVTLETIAYAKIMLHASKYRHCAVNGILIANATKNRDGAKNQDLEIVDTVPLFHHSHYVSPMAEIALTQIEAAAQADNKVIAGYYAGCENFRDNTVDACPGQKIAEKIVEYFPSAVFIVIDNKKVMEHLETPAIKLHRYIDGKWKQREINMKTLFTNPDVLKTVSYLLEWGVEKDLVDFDNYLDDITQDWTNKGIEKLLAMSKKYSDNKTKTKE